jgi:vacuolar-type H+-ATPase subunit I/STV1|tara:strand:+ start:357 stop:782 length:426 start_codon:yes stop_codon:yes gene_type:complete
MGFFTKKKEMKKELPPLKFPEFPKYESEMHHSDDFSQIKEAVSTPNLPTKPSFDIPDMPDTMPEPSETHRTERTLFIKVDKYKSVMKNLDHIKDKLEELEKVVNKLDDIKKEEDEELSKWHSDLEHLKERLSNIDKTLFEN